MQTEYVRLGAIDRCPHCAAVMIPSIPQGGHVPIHEYELTYADFRRLIEDSDYREAVAPLFTEWFGYSIAGEGPSVMLMNKAGDLIDPLSLHLLIQADPNQRGALYRTAMSLWR